MDELKVSAERLKQLKERLSRVKLVDEDTELIERSRKFERAAYLLSRDTERLSDEDLNIRLR